MKQRLPLLLSATALVVAVLGSTPLGHAMVGTVPPFARHAKTADFATNAGAVNGFRASRNPRAGWLVALGKDGKLPASVGQVGPAGPQGPKGDQGPPGPAGQKGATGLKGSTGSAGPTGPSGPAGSQGPSGIGGWTFRTQGFSVAAGSFGGTSALCPPPTKALGGGVTLSPGQTWSEVIQSGPQGQADGWEAVLRNTTSSSSLSAFVWVICATVS